MSLVGAVRQHTAERSGRPPLVGIAFALLAAGLGFVVLRAATDVGGHALENLTSNWVYMAVEFVAIGLCAARVVRRRDQRVAWALLTAALVCWSAGDLIWAVWLDNLARPPFPSVADACYLCMYPLLYAALMLLIRSRMRYAAGSQWLDGAVVALAVGGAAAALVFGDVLASTSGRLVADAVTIGYPVGDFILLMIVAVAVTLGDVRLGRDWAILGAGLVLMAVADIINADQVAGGIYFSGGWLNALYLASFSLLACAAWATSPEATKARALDASHTIVLTFVAGFIALIVLVIAACTPVNALAVALSCGSLIAAVVRSALTYRENVRILRAASLDAVTDALTGLGNRRRLTADLDAALAQPAQESTLVFFDLNGFKRYNDSFGHLAGDALLSRLAGELAAVVGDAGTTYRLGGDEFCILLAGRFPRHDRLIGRAGAALTDRGRGFDVTTAIGVAILPEEASSGSAALRLADERMYADKGSAHRGPTRDVLMQLLSEHTPELHDHISGVTSVTAAVAGRFPLSTEQLDETLRAAELHDIGKLAIPDNILNKAGPLDPAEWEFMQQHPVIGERILAAAPALAPVAALVRASHERWDGGGYPDGLSGDAIPLGARIVAVCDAYDAMTSERCYQQARSPADALAELRRSAGTQFDPAVVEAICEVMADPSPTSAVRYVREGAER